MALTLMENFHAVFYTPFYAAFALQAYEAESLEVQRVMSTNPAETAQALHSGRADAGDGGPSTSACGWRWRKSRFCATTRWPSP